MNRKTNITVPGISKLIVIGLTLLSACVLSAQTTHTWTGGSGGDSWSNPMNWDTNTTPVNGDSLIFLGDVSYVNNDYPGDPLNQTIDIWGILIASSAEEDFILDGNQFRIRGSIINATDYHVYINAALSTTASLVLDTGAGGMTLYGGTSVGAAGHNIAKEGSGTLTLSSGTYGRGTDVYISDGELILDGATWYAPSNGAGRIYMGGTAGTAATPTTSAVLRLTNESHARAGLSMSITAHSGANKIIIEEGSSLRFGADNGAGNINNVAGATLNIDVTDGGQFLHPGNGWIEDTGAGSTGRGYHTTLTELVGGVKKTGFAYAFDGVVGRVTTTLDDLPTSGYTSNGSYKTSGHFTISGSAGSGNYGSLTIVPTAVGDGTGSLTSAGTQNFFFQAVLMEEGTKDYTINISSLRSGGDRTFHIHQYSMDGTLTFTGATFSQTAALVKTGPGTVRFNGSADSSHRSLTHITEGRLILDSNFVLTSNVLVRGATSVLSGNGGIGGGVLSGNPRYTPVLVFDSGTLEADRHLQKALSIVGSLEFWEDGNYKIQLHEDMSYDPLTVLGTTTGDSPTAALVTLAGNLDLSLYYAVDPFSPDAIILLRTDGSIVGSFDTINGNSFIGGNQFFLTYNSEEHWFQIDYGYDLGGGFTAIALHAIPEPSTIALILGGALLGFLCIRRKRALSDNSK